MFISLPFGISLTFLLGLLSAVLIAVTFRHLATKSSVLFCLLLFLFSSTVAIAVSPLLFSLIELPCRSLLLSAIFNSRCHFYCHDLFSSLLSILSLFSQQYRGFSFKAGPFFCRVAIFALVLVSLYSFCC